MKKEKPDLRIRKTKRALYQALEDLLKKKSLNQITVTELSALAEINKGTFYLHYGDIYELYQDALSRHLKEIVERMDYMPLLFTNAEKFADKLITTSLQEAIFQDDIFFKKENIPFNQNAFVYFCNTLSEKALACGEISNTPENRSKLMFLFSGTGTLLRYYDGTDTEIIKGILTSSIVALFPPV